MFQVDRLLAILLEFKQPSHAARAATIKLTYLYYKNDSIYEKIHARLEKKGQSAASNKNIYFLDNSQKVISDLVKITLKSALPRLRVRATLCQVYHHALHNRLREAKDLLMKTHMN